MHKSLFFGLLFILALAACGDDDEMTAVCTTPPAIEENIIGTWKSSATNDLVEFQTGGVLIDDNDAILGISDTIPETKTYAFVVADSIDVTTTADGGGSASARFAIANTSCDIIAFGVFGISVPFNREN